MKVISDAVSHILLSFRSS